MSKNHDAHRAGDLVPVEFSRLTRRGVLLGLSLSQLVVLGLGVGTLVWAFYAGGGILIALTSPVWLASAAVVWVRVAGRAPSSQPRNTSLTSITLTSLNPTPVNLRADKC